MSRVVRVYEDGYRLGVLCKEGTRWDHVVVIDVPIDVRRFPADDPQYEYQEADPATTAKRLLDMAGRFGITERARALLQQVADNSDTPGAEEDDDKR